MNGMTTILSRWTFPPYGNNVSGRFTFVSGVIKLVCFNQCGWKTRYCNRMSLFTILPAHHVKRRQCSYKCVMN